MNVLSYAQFSAKHRQKFAGLTAADKHKRYDEYVAQQRAKHETAVVRRHAEPRLRAPPSDAASSAVARVKSKPIKATDLPPILKAMLDPFHLADVGAAPPRVPDGEHLKTATVLFQCNVPLYSDSTGGVAFVLRASPWCAWAQSGVSSFDVTGGSPAGKFLANMEWQVSAYNVREIHMQVGTGLWARAPCWSIPGSTANDPGDPNYNTYNPTYGLQDMPNASSMYDAALAWRPVCAGAEFKYTGPPLEASGQICCALVPGSTGMPLSSNTVFSLNQIAQKETTDAELALPTFTNLQTLRDAKVYPAVGGVRQIWQPSSTAAQTHWRAVKPNVHSMGSSIGGSDVAGFVQVSDPLLSGVFVSPPPVNGSTDRMLALVDRLYTENGWAYAPSTLPGGTHGANTNLYFFQDAGLSDTNNAVMANFKQTAMLNLHRGDLHPEDNYLFWIGEGFPPGIEVGTIRTVVGVEFIPDSRSGIFGGAGEKMLAMPRSAQVDQHAAAVAVMRDVPSSASAQAPQSTFVQDAVAFINGATTVGRAVVDGVTSIAEAMGPVLAAAAAF